MMIHPDAYPFFTPGGFAVVAGRSVDFFFRTPVHGFFTPIYLEMAAAMEEAFEVDNFRTEPDMGLPDFKPYAVPRDAVKTSLLLTTGTVPDHVVIR